MKQGTAGGCGSGPPAMDLAVDGRGRRGHGAPSGGAMVPCKEQRDREGMVREEEREREGRRRRRWTTAY